MSEQHKQSDTSSAREARYATFIERKSERKAWQQKRDKARASKRAAADWNG